MRVTIDALKRFPQINQIIDVAASSSEVHSVGISVNSALVNAWRLRMTLGDKQFVEALDDLAYFTPSPRLNFNYFIDQLSTDFFQDEQWHPHRPLQLDDLYGTAEFLPKRFGAFLQRRIVNLEICTYPGVEYQPPYFGQGIEGLQVGVVARPISELWSNTKKEYRPLLGGISVGAETDRFGTLGGILKCNKTGKKYGITCAHVVGDGNDVFQPARADNGVHAIGKVLKKSDLMELPAKYYNNKNVSVANSMDVAVIELNENGGSAVLDIGDIEGTFPDYDCTPYQSVSFTGRTSGYQPYLTNEQDAPFVDFLVDGKKYRYTNLMRIRFKALHKMFFSRPSKTGDSGAWVCIPQEDKMKWAGMIVGGYLHNAYAIPSERIISWIKDNAGLDLTT